MDVRLHRRQFMLGPRLPVPEGWRHVDLRDGLTLSHCPELPVADVRDATGRRWLLLGIAVQTAAGQPEPLSQIQSARHDAISTLARDWAGRWLLVSGDTVQMDPGGLLGCFIRVTDRGTWVSSSPALLATVAHVAVPELLPHVPLRAGEPMDWYPPPASRFRGMSRLVPGDSLIRLDGGWADAPREPLEDRSGDQYGTLLDQLESRLTTALQALAIHGKKLLIPLTAGYDSRLLLAVANAAEVEHAAYTYLNPWMAQGDRELPPELARRVGIEHIAVSESSRDEPLGKIFDAHTAGHHVGIDRWYLTRGHWGSLRKDSVIVRGGVFETGRCFYHGRLPSDPEKTPERLAAVVVDGFRLPADDEPRLQGVRRWAERFAQRSDNGIDWRDRFYLQQRVGGWLSSLEQGLDLTGYERVHAANCATIVSALASLPVGVRAESRHHVDLIARMAPRLLELPFNPPDPPPPLPGRLVRRGRRLLVRIARRTARQR